MKADKSTIDYIAHLSRLNLEGSDEDNMLGDLNTILDWVKKLEEVDTTDVAPLYHMTEHTSVVREDVANNALSREKALKNAPKQDGTFFRVPKVLE